MRQHGNTYWFFLISIITDSGLPPFGRDDNGMGDDRIAHRYNPSPSNLKNVKS